MLQIRGVLRYFALMCSDWCDAPDSPPPIRVCGSDQRFKISEAKYLSFLLYFHKKNKQQNIGVLQIRGVLRYFALMCSDWCDAPDSPPPIRVCGSDQRFKVFASEILYVCLRLTTTTILYYYYYYYYLTFLLYYFTTLLLYYFTT